MITILVFGLLLFIAAIGGTYLYDKHKAFQAKIKDSNEFTANSKPDPSILAKANRDAIALKRKMKGFFTNNNPISTRPVSQGGLKTRVVKPGSSKANYNKTETMSLEELIAHIEKLKKQ